jgi:2-keto-3-deoxy-L-rhamnonate aldolase RhmA
VQIKAFSQRVDKPPQVISAVLSVLEPATALVLSGYDSAWIDEANAQPMFKETLAGVVTYQQPVIIRVYAGD